MTMDWFAVPDMIRPGKLRVPPATVMVDDAPAVAVFERVRTPAPPLENPPPTPSENVRLHVTFWPFVSAA